MYIKIRVQWTFDYTTITVDKTLIETYSIIA